jgi:hypothetical protein
VLYLVNEVTGFFCIIYVSHQAVRIWKRSGDRPEPPRFREAFHLGIASEVICAVEYIYLLWVLYRLQSPFPTFAAAFSALGARGYLRLGSIASRL